MRGRTIWVRATVLAAALTACALVLTGFGGSADASAKTLIMAVANSPTSLDPDLYQGIPSDVTYPIFGSPLLRYRDVDAAKVLPGPFAVRGFVARSWQRDADGGYRFTLSSMKSPFGNTVSAEDVKWSLERHAALNAVARFLFGVANIDLRNPVTVLGRNTFKLNVTAPSGVVLGSLTHYTMTIVDSQEAKKHATTADPWAREWLTNNTASFGPYTMSGFQSGQTLFLKTNPNFAPRPKIAQVVIRAVPDANGRLSLVLSGQAHYADALAYEQIASASTNKNVKIFNGPSPQFDFMALNQAYKPFADVRVRRALNLAVDRSALLRAIYRGYATAGTTQIPGAVPTPYDPPPHGHNVAEARRLLAEAGQSNLEFRLTVCPCRPGAYAIQLGELIQSQLAAVGVKVTLDIVATSAEFEAARLQKKFTAWLYAGGPVVLDPTYAASLYYASTGIQNSQNYVNPQLDRLLRIALTAPPGKRRDRTITSIVKILETDLPYVPLVDRRNLKVWSVKVTGYISGDASSQPAMPPNVDKLDLGK